MGGGSMSMEEKSVIRSYDGNRSHFFAAGQILILPSCLCIRSIKSSGRSRRHESERILKLMALCAPNPSQYLESA